jgi:hypothetical protein
LHAENVTVFPGAISDTTGKTRLFFVDGHIGDSRIYDPKDGHEQGVEVETLTIDDLLDRAGLDGTKLFIKLDVQGFEPQVLRGMRKTLAGAEDIILYTELTEDTLSAAGTSVANYVALIRELGFLPVDQKADLADIAWPSIEEIGQSKDWCFRYRPGSNSVQRVQ